MQYYKKLNSLFLEYKQLVKFPIQYSATWEMECKLEVEKLILDEHVVYALDP